MYRSPVARKMTKPSVDGQEPTVKQHGAGDSLQTRAIGDGFFQAQAIGLSENLGENAPIIPLLIIMLPMK